MVSDSSDLILDGERGREVVSVFLTVSNGLETEFEMLEIFPSSSAENFNFGKFD